jgi:hypothetical protein
MTSSTVLLYVIAGELGLLLLPEILWGSRWSRRVSVVVSCRRLTLGLVFLLVLVRLVIVEAMARRAERRRRRKWSVRISVSSVVHPQNLTTKKTLLEIHKHFFFAKKKKKKKPQNWKFTNSSLHQRRRRRQQQQQRKRIQEALSHAQQNNTNT